MCKNYTFLTPKQPQSQKNYKQKCQLCSSHELLVLCWVGPKLGVDCDCDCGMPGLGHSPSPLSPHPSPAESLQSPIPRGLPFTGINASLRCGL